uniref:Cyclic nucleotide-binding domain-containing protein n=1 Tax=Strombidium rassoulzadegani TaxID=1082188 RepID=A0A7S3CPI6_9SPIT|mmetsp:Transcript_2659/g.4463  ORF Transcript_2659/g.4463 Transcript_2659/m.4463 type:complete len:496 (+) Transcript_2659:1045-2532(+)
MIVGVNIYSFTIGNVSSIIASMDSKAALLNSKLNTLTEYALKYNLPATTQAKIKNYFENQARTIGNDGDWESLFQELPPSLRTDVVQSTHGQIIKGIRFFRDKPQDFLINIIPKLKSLNLFDNDILFSQGDQAEEVFFIFHGSVLLYVDLSEIVDMSIYVKEDSSFNVPLAIYSNGSYFGDNDVMLQRNGYRSMSGICNGDCQIYSIKNNMLEECLEKNPEIKATMLKIAEEKNNYYYVLKDELRLKYKSKRTLEQLYQDKKDDQWTFYISLKRQMVKKQNALQNKIGKMLMKDNGESKEKKVLEKQEKLAKKRKAQTKKIAAMLGQKRIGNIHLDKYTQELKNLIGKLHDDNLDAVQNKGAQKEVKNDFMDQINEDDQLIFDSDDDQQHKAKEKLQQILKQAQAPPSNERKEKLKIRLLNESQTYYQNNLNIFCNSLSLLAVNSLEMHGYVHQINGQTEQMQNLAFNIEAHSSFMKQKTEEMYRKLKEIQKTLK